MTDISFARWSDTFMWAALVLYVAALVPFFVGMAPKRARLAAVGTGFATFGAVVHALSIAFRGLAAGRVPWGNMYEYSSMIGLLTVIAYLVFLDARMKLRSVGGFAVGAAAATLAGARLVYVPAGPLVPALNSYWLKIHVIAAITASSLFGLAFIFTVLYVIKDRIERRSSATFAGSTVGAASIVDSDAPVSDLDSEEQLDRVEGARGLLSRLPAASTFDTLSFRIIQIAFPVWTFAVIAGAVWAHEAWGRYWGWDPKETWAFVTWVIYAGYLHARSTAGWRGMRASILSGVGFVSLMFTYFAVNLWISGLHSYAK